MLCSISLFVYLGGYNWETNDDPCMALVLARYGSENVPFSNHLYLYFFDILYNITGKYNWWLIISLTEIFVALGFILFILINTLRINPKYVVLCAIVTIVTYFYAIRQINFTRTACYIANTGLFLIVLGVWGKIRNKVPMIIMGVFFFFMGACIRMESAILVIPMAALLFLGIRENEVVKKAVFMAGTALVICILVYMTDRMCMTESMKEWTQRQSIRHVLCDYPMVINEDVDWETLNRAELYESDLLFLRGLRFADKKVYNDENIRLLIDNVQKHVDLQFIYNEICKIMKFGSIIWFFVIACILYVIFAWNWKVLALNAVMIAICSIYFLILGRVDT